MSAFAGIIRHDLTPIPESCVRALTDDGARIVVPSADDSVRFVSWSNGLVGAGLAEAGLGARGLANGQIFLCDVRLDNRNDIAAALGKPSAHVADEDLAACACELGGISGIETWIGAFAVARWDPVLRRLLLARDRVGVRPIYYHATPEYFAFSTDMRAVLALPFVPRSLNEETIARTLVSNGDGAPSATYYNAVHSLPAAHALYLENGHVAVSQYWQAKPRGVSVAVATDYAAELRHRISEAVDCRLRGGRRVAVHLSGGLDSSAIACLAARRLKAQGQRLLAICSVLAPGHTGPEDDERSYIESVLAQEDNIDPVWTPIAVDVDPFGALESQFDALMQPPYSNVTHAERALAVAGQAHGVDVVLSGFGGDMFASVSGATSAQDMVRSGQIRMALATMRALHREQGTAWTQMLRRAFCGTLLSRLRPLAMISAADARFVRRMQAGNLRLAPTRMERLAIADSMAFVASPGHIERVLAPYVQFFAREFGQDLRFPLLDVRVIEWMLQMPLAQLQLGGWPRSVMRRAMVGILPEKIRMRRDKGGAFDPAITSRFVSARSDLIRWTNETADARCWRYVDRAMFQDVLQRLQATKRGGWRAPFFQVVIAGGVMARFIAWHDRMLGDADT